MLSSVVETGFQCIFWPISGHIKPGALLSPLRVFFPLIKSVQNGVTFGAASVGDGAGIRIRIGEEKVAAVSETVFLLLFMTTFENFCPSASVRPSQPNFSDKKHWFSAPFR